MYVKFRAIFYLITLAGSEPWELIFVKFSGTINLYFLSVFQLHRGLWTRELVNLQTQS